MSATFDDWLPPDAFDDRRIKATVVLVIEDWVARWFARPLAHSVTIVRSDAADHAGAPGERWVSFGNPVSFRWSNCSGAALARLAVDAPPGRAATAPGDARLLENFGQAMALDLTTDLTTALKLQKRPAQPLFEVCDPLSKYGKIEIEVLAGIVTSLMRIAIPIRALVAFRKSIVRSLPPEPPRSTPLIDAFDREALSYSAVLGQAAMSLADVQGLEIGDVLLLDTRLSDRIPVVSSKSGTTVSVARVSQHQGRIELILESALGSSK